MTAYLAAGASVLGIGLFALTSKHRFRPDPEKPSQCAQCGRRADTHTT